MRVNERKVKGIAKCDASEDENNDNSLTSEEDVVVGDSEDEWEPETKNESASIVGNEGNESGP